MAFPEETSWPAAARGGFDDPLRVAWTGAQRGRGNAASRKSPVELDSFSSVSALAAVETDARRPREPGAQRGPRWDWGSRLPPLHLQAMRCRHSGLRGAGQESQAAAPGHAVLCLGRSCCGASGLDTQTSGWGRLPRGPASSPHHGTPSPQRPCPISGALPVLPGRAPLPLHSASLLEHSRLGGLLLRAPAATATTEWVIHF